MSSEQREGARVWFDGDIKGNDLVEEDGGVEGVVSKREQEHAERQHDAQAAQVVARQRLGAEEPLKEVLPRAETKKYMHALHTQL